jgi:hypothetical protein
MPANDAYNLPPVDSGSRGFGECFISEMMRFADGNCPPGEML